MTGIGRRAQSEVGGVRKRRKNDRLDTSCILNYDLSIAENLRSRKRKLAVDCSPIGLSISSVKLQNGKNPESLTVVPFQRRWISASTRSHMQNSRKISPKQWKATKKTTINSSGRNKKNVASSIYSHSDTSSASPSPYKVCNSNNLAATIIEPMRSQSNVGATQEERNTEGITDSVSTYDRFNIKNFMEWLIAKAKTAPSQSQDLLEAILRRDTTFLNLIGELSRIQNNGYLMENQTVEQLYSLVLDTLRSNVEGELKAITSNYHCVLGIFTAVRGPNRTYKSRI